MVNVTLFRDALVDGTGTASRTVLVGFEVKGHADFAQRGVDIVCAGVSAMAQSTALGLSELLGDRVQCERSPGFLRFSMSKDQAGSDAAVAVMRSLELGLASISRVHPDYVRVEYRDK